MTQEHSPPVRLKLNQLCVGWFCSLTLRLKLGTERIIGGWLKSGFEKETLGAWG